mmetsp:Transcript_8879/g.21629  ORF Transcript_8879/g.21629 Transcript_8879/m.21629 type:complete len:1142 (-) Transcript_8879:222-3647(-)|eukprot:CAMPEP_0178991048 /NCGR_PEP_ID=MMETSP0795-20121207/5305_1 /TAXON_ID=88552 /ORGANISM="Amoebophrya sp., Strain Ameob2" /LENGTH=1141 /DNA_ID=CAMNT_0020682701 /DNA_START=483 /DNA_END=3908 /DNA_ORIENTATION=-
MAEVLAPWRVEHDPSNGRPYYYNTQTGDVRWTKPGEAWSLSYDTVSNTQYWIDGSGNTKPLQQNGPSTPRGTTSLGTPRLNARSTAARPDWFSTNKDEILQKRTLEPRTQYAEEDELRFQQQLLLQQNPGLLPTIRTPRERPDPYLYTPPQPSGAGGASASDAPAAPVSSAMVPRITTPRKSITPLGTPRGGSTGGGGSYSQLTAQNVQQLNALTPGDTGTVAGGMPQLNLQGSGAHAHPHPHRAPPPAEGEQAPGCGHLTPRISSGDDGAASGPCTPRAITPRGSPKNHSPAARTGEVLTKGTTSATGTGPAPTSIHGASPGTPRSSLQAIPQVSPTSARGGGGESSTVGHLPSAPASPTSASGQQAAAVSGAYQRIGTPRRTTPRGGISYNYTGPQPIDSRQSAAAPSSASIPQRQVQPPASPRLSGVIASPRLSSSATGGQPPFRFQQQQAGGGYDYAGAGGAYQYEHQAHAQAAQIEAQHPQQGPQQHSLATGETQQHLASPPPASRTPSHAAQQNEYADQTQAPQSSQQMISQPQSSTASAGVYSNDPYGTTPRATNNDPYAATTTPTAQASHHVHQVEEHSGRVTTANDPYAQPGIQEVSGYAPATASSWSPYNDQQHQQPTGGAPSNDPYQASPYHQPAESVPAANDPYNAVLAPAPQMNPGSYGNGYGYATATSSGYGTSWDGGSNQSAYHAPYPDPTPAAQQQHYSQQQHAHPTYAYPGNYQQPAPVYPQPQVPYLHDPADPAGPPAAYPPFDRTQANNDRHGSISSSAPSIQRPKRIPLSQVAMSATQQRTGIYPTPQQLAEQRYAEMNPESLPPQRPLFVEQGLLPSPRNFSAPPPGRGAHFQQQHFPPPPMGLGGGVMGGLPAPQPGGLVPSQGVRPIYNQSRQQAAAPTRSVDDSFRYDTNLSAAAMAGLFTSPGPLAASGRDGGGGGNHSFGAQHEEMMNGLEEMIRHGRSATERDFSPEERDKVKKWVRKAQELKGQVVEALAESWSSWNNGGGRRVGDLVDDSIGWSAGGPGGDGGAGGRRQAQAFADMYVDHRGGPSPGDGFRYGLPGSGDNDEGGLSEEKSALRVKIESSLEYLFSKFLGRSSERTSFDGGGAPGMPGDFYSNGGGAAPPGPGSYVGGDGGFP